MKFKVFDEERKILIDKDFLERFFLGANGELYIYSALSKKITEADPKFKIVVSAEKTDTNGIELFNGDKVEQGVIILENSCWYIKLNNNGRLSNLDLFQSEDLLKIDSEYEEK